MVELSRNTSAVLLPTSLPFLPTVNQLSKPTVRPALSLDDVSSLCQQFSHRAFSSITVVSVTHMDVLEEYSVLVSGTRLCVEGSALPSPR